MTYSGVSNFTGRITSQYVSLIFQHCREALYSLERVEREHRPV